MFFLFLRDKDKHIKLIIENKWQRKSNFSHNMFIVYKIHLGECMEMLKALRLVVKSALTEFSVGVERWYITKTKQNKKFWTSPFTMFCVNNVLHDIWSFTFYKFHSFYLQSFLSTIMFSFICIVPNHNNCNLRVVYIVRCKYPTVVLEEMVLNPTGHCL